MIVNDLNLSRALFSPYETNPVSLIYPHAVLSHAIPAKRLKVVPGRNSQVVKTRC